MKLDPEERNVDWRNIDNEYYWNYQMYKLYNVPNKWRTIWIQGYFNIKVQYLTKDIQIHLGILSRRQWKRGGTRMNARGIDDEGYVGNFVETESFMILHKVLYTFTQIRGSVPLFWKQEGMKGFLVFKREPANSLKAFKKHYKYIDQNYGKVLMVNLLGK